MNIVKTGLLVATVLGGMVSAQADAATFLFSYSGAAFGNSATATGSFDIADSALASVSHGFTFGYGSVSNLTMTVSGAGAGNGIFDTKTFATFLFWSPSQLDFTKQLVGQSLTDGTRFGQLGQGGFAGDFNLFSGAIHAPTGYGTFTLGANRGLGAKMALTSLMVSGAVPEPASWAMMIVGVGAIGVALRRRSKVTTTVSYAS